MTRESLDLFIRNRRCTLLGAGPMSRNCVDVMIDEAKRRRIPFFLVASRRQIDSQNCGGGYVNRWTTPEFATYVRQRDPEGWVTLARDHGGPWQNDRELRDGLSLDEAMASAKNSYREDIESGFGALHIDTSIDPSGAPSFEVLCRRAFELYAYCCEEAHKQGSLPLFEIGTEEQSGVPAPSLEELRELIRVFQDFCRTEKYPSPTFLVVQTGTKVLETRNVGSFDSPFRIAYEIPAEIQVPKMIEICNGAGIYMKEHNGDYLSDEALRWHPKLGIHAMNVAPEFGVAESSTLIRILEENGGGKLVERFIALVCQSGKWKKWLLPDSRTNDRDKAMIAGHYVFSSPEFIDIKKEAEKMLEKKGYSLETCLQAAIRKSLLRYLHLLCLI